MFKSTHSVILEMEAVMDVFGYVSCGIAEWFGGLRHMNADESTDKSHLGPQ